MLEIIVKIFLKEENMTKIPEKINPENVVEATLYFDRTDAKSLQILAVLTISGFKFNERPIYKGLDILSVSGETINIAGTLKPPIMFISYRRGPNSPEETIALLDAETILKVLNIQT
jgi:hypothetical protein